MSEGIGVKLAESYAKAIGFERLIDTGLSKDGKRVYQAGWNTEEKLCVGYPTVFLVGKRSARLATRKEVLEIIRSS